MKQRRKFTKKEKIALAVLGLLMAVVIAAGTILIVNNVNEANREATNTAHTTIKFTKPAPTEKIKDGVTEKIIDKKTSSKSGKSTKATDATASTSKTEEPANTSKTKSETKKTEKKKNNTSKPSKKTEEPDNKIPVVTPEKNDTHKSDEKCVINGTTCYVGDTISVTLNLTTPKVLINYQGYTDFDSEYLKIVSAKSNTSGLVNGKANQILYNASDLNGLDFTSKGTIYTATFKVKKAGSTSIKNTFEVLSDMDLKPVSVSSCKSEIVIYN